jgi:hypothetical protein
MASRVRQTVRASQAGEPAELSSAAWYPLGARSKSSFADRRRPIEAPILPIPVASQAAAATAVPAGIRCAAPERPSSTASTRGPVPARHCATPSSKRPVELASRKITETLLTRAFADTASLITATLVGSRLCWTATRAAALESGMANPTLKPITLSTPPASANPGRPPARGPGDGHDARQRGERERQAEPECQLRTRRIAAYAFQRSCKVVFHSQREDHDLDCHQKTRQWRDQCQRGAPEAAQISMPRRLGAPMSMTFPAWLHGSTVSAADFVLLMVIPFGLPRVGVNKPRQESPLVIRHEITK